MNINLFFFVNVCRFLLCAVANLLHFTLIAYEFQALQYKCIHISARFCNAWRC